MLHPLNPNTELERDAVERNPEPHEVAAYMSVCGGATSLLALHGPATIPSHGTADELLLLAPPPPQALLTYTGGGGGVNGDGGAGRDGGGGQGVVARAILSLGRRATSC